MTLTELLVIVSGLAIGYWFVGVFIPHARSDAGEDAEAAAERESVPGPRDDRPWHVVLGVRSDASPEEVSSAYKRLIAQFHPDKVATMAPEIRDLAQRRSAEINAAYREASKRIRA
jgi:DnaJ like chaperone protein